MKKIILAASLLLTLSGIWLTGCEPSRKGGVSPSSADSLSAPANATDSSMHMDTSNQKR